MAHTVLPHAIGTLLDRFPAARCLSLDCFDTLLWRDVHAPVDLFAALPGSDRVQRARAESAARKARLLAGQGSEVTLAEIHARLAPNAGTGQREAAMAAELAAEAAHCYAFAPTVDLMRQARARGLQVVIVSDTYFDEAQLRALIAAAAGEDVAALVDRIFCSSTHGVSKARGLYSHVLAALDHRPETILHVGDNFAADVEGVGRAGVTCVHLVQFSDAARQRMRLEAAADALVHPHLPGAETRAGRALQPHRAALALGEPQGDCPARRLGASVLGPLLHAFDHWLQDEARALQAQHGGTVHWLFLMRDGYLPLRVHEANDQANGARGAAGQAHAVEISRFTATAAHFTDEPAIARFVDEEIGLRPATLARQLLLDEGRIAALVDGLSLQDGSRVLLKETRSGPFRKTLLRRSRAFADRLEAHVRRACNPAPGDVLMLVDLGYNGTVQNRIAALLAARLGVHVAGRYLLLREQQATGLDKRGLIDDRHYSPEVLGALCGNVALLEQLCTVAQGSVVDYAADGSPIRSGNDIKDRQSAVREAVQAGCLAFQHWAAEAMVRTPQDPAARAALWRQAAASVLARAVFLPLPDELAVVEAFEHDVNMGTARTVPLFDRAVAEQGLRHRGLFYMNGAERMFLPAEIAEEALATRLSLMAHRLFDPPFAFADFGGAGIAVPVTFVDPAGGGSRRTVTATATHDGFYTLPVPVGDSRLHVALHLGDLFEWLELERAVFVPVDEFVGRANPELRHEVPAAPVLHGLASEGGRLLRCMADDAQLLVAPPAQPLGKPMLLAVTFRPLVRRAAVTAGTGVGANPAERAVA